MRLTDVRKNPVSMKFGFSKNQLIKACQGVGIENDKRQELNTQADYDKLFVYYKESILPEKSNEQKELVELLINKKRIALSCFEANVYQFHRKHLAEALGTFGNSNFEIRHI